MHLSRAELQERQRGVDGQPPVTVTAAWSLVTPRAHGGLKQRVVRRLWEQGAVAPYLRTVLTSRVTVTPISVTTTADNATIQLFKCRFCSLASLRYSSKLKGTIIA